MGAVEYYTTDDGRVPLEEWFAGIDDATLARILVRIERVALGSLGDHKPVGDGVGELRLDFGPGYRIYFGRVGKKVILLLCGGDKSTQKRDIKKAKKYLAEYKSRGT